MAMADVAAEHAEAIGQGLDAPVDVIGTSTAGASPSSSRLRSATTV
jgi:hypothetical protein